MAGDYSEDKLIEQTSLHIFKEMLNWETIVAYDNEDFGPASLLGRNSRKEVLLYRYLNKWLRKLNAGLPDDAYNAAIEKLEEYPSSKSIAEINHEKYSYL